MTYCHKYSVKCMCPTCTRFDMWHRRIGLIWRLEAGCMESIQEKNLCILNDLQLYLGLVADCFGSIISSRCSLGCNINQVTPSYWKLYIHQSDNQESPKQTEPNCSQPPPPPTLQGRMCRHDGAIVARSLGCLARLRFDKKQSYVSNIQIVRENFQHAQIVAFTGDC